MTVLPCSELRQSRGHLAWLILLAPLLMQCNPERLVIVHVDLSPEVPPKLAEQVIQFEVRTSLDNFDSQTFFELFDDAGMEKQLPLGIGIYHHQRSGDLTVRVHALVTGKRRVAGGSVVFKLDDQSTEIVDQLLTLTPCVDPDKGLLTEVCSMPEPTDGGDAGDARDAEDAGDAGDSGDGSTDVEGGNGDGGDDGGGNGGCPAGDAGTAAFAKTAGPTPAACDSYCATATALCPGVFPRLPSPTQATGNPAPVDICRLACAAAKLADDTTPTQSALTCRTSEASMAQCVLASLISPDCRLYQCEAFCRMDETICGASYPDCQRECVLIDFGDLATEPVGNTLACRLAWLERAMFDPTSCGAAQTSPLCGPCQAIP